jgi:hypothetical protein
MASEPETPGQAGTGIGDRGSTHSRVFPIGAHNPTTLASVCSVRDARSPEQRDSKFGRSSYQDLVKPGSPKRQSEGALKTRLDGDIAVYKPDASYRITVIAREPNS